MVVTKFFNPVSCECCDFRSESFYGLTRRRDRTDEARLRHTTPRLGDNVTHLTVPVRDYAKLPFVEAANRIAAFEPVALVVDYDGIIMEAIHHSLDVMRVEARDVCPQ